MIYVLAFVLCLVGGIIFILGVISLSDSFDAREFVGSLAIILFGSVFFILGTAVGNEGDKADIYQKETIEICAKKGGTVNDDQLCIVDGKPVQYSEGVWTR